MYFSRYAKYGPTRIPKRKMTIPVKGKGTETGKYFKCWNCGAICNVERETLDISGRGGNSVAEYIDESPAEFSDINSITPAIESLTFNYQTLMSSGADSVNLNSYYSRKPKTIGGCWFCGSRNWK